MNIVRCDICDKEMRITPFGYDSETQYYTLINKYGGRDLETDICNECMHKLIDFVNAPTKQSELTEAYTRGYKDGAEQSREEGEWVHIAGSGYRCSNCNEYTKSEKPFHKPKGNCPNCGSKMKGTDDE